MKFDYKYVLYLLTLIIIAVLGTNLEGIVKYSLYMTGGILILIVSLYQTKYKANTDKWSFLGIVISAILILVCLYKLVTL